MTFSWVIQRYKSGKNSFWSYFSNKQLFKKHFADRQTPFRMMFVEMHNPPVSLSLSMLLKRELCNTLQWNGIIPPSLNFSLLDCWKKQDSLFFSLFTPVLNSCTCHCWPFSHTDPHFLSGVSVAMTTCRKLTYENA